MTFYYEINPLPEYHKLKQAGDVEKRHEFMLSVILDRLCSVARYDKEGYPPSKRGNVEWHRKKNI